MSLPDFSIAAIILPLYVPAGCTGTVTVATHRLAAQRLAERHRVITAMIAAIFMIFYLRATIQLAGQVFTVDISTGIALLVISHYALFQWARRLFDGFRSSTLSTCNDINVHAMPGFTKVDAHTFNLIPDVTGPLNDNYRHKPLRYAIAHVIGMTPQATSGNG